MAQWIDMPGYKGRYEVNTKGEVRNAETKRMLTVQRENTEGARVRLSKDGVERSFRIAKLAELVAKRMKR